MYHLIQNVTNKLYESQSIHLSHKHRVTTRGPQLGMSLWRSLQLCWTVERPAFNIPLDIQESSPVSLGQQGVKERIENTTEIVENSWKLEYLPFDIYFNVKTDFCNQQHSLLRLIWWVSQHFHLFLIKTLQELRTTNHETTWDINLRWRREGAEPGWGDCPNHWWESPGQTSVAGRGMETSRGRKTPPQRLGQHFYYIIVEMSDISSTNLTS